MYKRCCAAPPSTGSLRSIRLPLPRGPRWAGQTLLPSPLQAFVQIMEKKTESWLKKPQPTHCADVHNWTFTRKLAPVKIRVRSRNSIRARRGGAAGGARLYGKIQLCCRGRMDLGLRKALGEQEEPGRAGRGHQAPAGPRCHPPMASLPGGRMGTHPCKQGSLSLYPTEIRS